MRPRLERKRTPKVAKTPGSNSSERQPARMPCRPVFRVEPLPHPQFDGHTCQQQQGRRQVKDRAVIEGVRHGAAQQRAGSQPGAEPDLQQAHGVAGAVARRDRSQQRAGGGDGAGDQPLDGAQDHQLLGRGHESHQQENRRPPEHRAFHHQLAPVAIGDGAPDGRSQHHCERLGGEDQPGKDLNRQSGVGPELLDVQRQEGENARKADCHHQLGKKQDVESPLPVRLRVRRGRVHRKGGNKDSADAGVQAATRGTRVMAIGSRAWIFVVFPQGWWWVMRLASRPASRRPSAPGAPPGRPAHPQRTGPRRSGSAGGSGSRWAG